MRTPAVKIDVNFEILIVRSLARLGVPARLSGYEYIKVGLSKVLEEPDLLRGVTKELYPAIAKECDTTASCVERSMRHAIEVAFDRADLDTVGEYFGNTLSYRSGKPTNSEFVAGVAEYIRAESGVYG